MKISSQCVASRLRTCNSIELRVDLLDSALDMPHMCSIGVGSTGSINSKHVLLVGEGVCPNGVRLCSLVD